MSNNIVGLGVEDRQCWHWTTMCGQCNHPVNYLYYVSAFTGNI